LAGVTLSNLRKSVPSASLATTLPRVSNQGDGAVLNLLVCWEEILIKVVDVVVF
jgi:hypothetical protein